MHSGRQEQLPQSRDTFFYLLCLELPETTQLNVVTHKQPVQLIWSPCSCLGLTWLMLNQSSTGSVYVQLQTWKPLQQVQFNIYWLVKWEWESDSSSHLQHIPKIFPILHDMNLVNRDIVILGTNQSDIKCPNICIFITVTDRKNSCL